LIYARIKGFGLSGPYANYRVFDPLAQAAAGSVSTTGDAAGPPSQPGPSLADSGTGMQTAIAILAAYVQFLNTGVGQDIELSMQEATLSFMKTRLVAGWDGSAPIARRPSLGTAPSGMFPCAPGGANDFVQFTIVTSRMWDTLCIAMGRPALSSDERFATPSARAANISQLREEISAWTMQHTKHEAMQIAAEAGVPASAVFDSVDVFNDPHLQARGFFTTVEHPTNGSVTLMTNPMRLSESPTTVVRAPLRGEHSFDILRSELGLSDEVLRNLADAGVVHPPGIGSSAR
jgi:formyl-CoA transferase